MPSTASSLHKGKAVIEINRRSRLVKAADGTTAAYDRLLLATGSNPFLLPVPGNNLPGVIGFRDIADVETMLLAAREYRHAVVIGGGLLGLEAANGLMKQGMKVTVVHLPDALMERQLDAPAAKMLKKSLEDRGLEFVLKGVTKEIIGKNRVHGVALEDGRELTADLVVMAVGIRPNIELAKKAGLYCERGVVVSDTMQTYDPAIYAVGECVQHRKLTYGLVAPLFEQAKVCANHLAHFGISRYEGSMTSTKLKVTGIDLFSAGNFTGNDQTEEIVLQDAGAGVYKKVVLKDNRIQGAVMYGDTMDGAWYFQLMRDGTDVSGMRNKLLFGQAHLGDSGHGDIKSRVSSMSDATEICGCNGVCKGVIVKTITDKKLFTLDEVRAHTKASSSCGSCTGLVEALLASTLGGDYSTTPRKKPMCPCTEHAHDDVRLAIRSQSLRTIPAVFRALDWKTADGCNKCRPALNFYLLVAWPGEYADDNQSRFINERAHANIQKDGTYSVIPRIWGGETTPAQLRSLAEIAEKYQVPTVHITGGQRIDFLGIPKETLPAMWGDLSQAGFVSGHAYGKAIRTVKTCVGKTWCRFGTQDSTALGIELEKDDLGFLDAAQVQARGFGVPAQLRRGDHQGLRRGVRGLGLRTARRRQRRRESARHRLSVRGKNPGGGEGVLRRLPAGLPRRGALSRTHRAVGGARRAYVREAKSGGRRGRPQETRGALLVFADVRPGRSLGRARQGRRPARIHPAETNRLKNKRWQIFDE